MRPKLLFALTVVAGSAGLCAAQWEAVTSDSIKNAILQLHNDARGAVGLPAMRWDSSLARSAENGIRHSCEIGGLSHDNSYNDEQDVGENLAWKWSGRGVSDSEIAREGTQGWIDERDDYHYSSNTCSGVCGHYTQVVWQGSDRVGCAIGACSSGAKDAYLSCHYKARGNSCNWKPYGRSAAYECTCLTNGANLCLNGGGGGNSGGGSNGGGGTNGGGTNGGGTNSNYNSYSSTNINHNSNSINNIIINQVNTNTNTNTNSGGSCVVESRQCLSTDGSSCSYSGTKATTHSGKTCQSWSSQSPHSHKFSGTANYCQNPDGHPGGPWCYTTDPDTRWDDCFQPCGPEDNGCVDSKLGCIHAASDACKALSSVGGKATTVSGKTCQAWASQSPHSHKYTGPGNACQNPDGHPGGPWCYTTDPATRWEDCVPSCESMDSACIDQARGCAEAGSAACEADGYNGVKSTTASGKTCQAWAAQSPHSHKYTGEGNLCQNPDGHPGGPWCYTTDPGTRWEDCFSPCSSSPAA